MVNYEELYIFSIKNQSRSSSPCLYINFQYMSYTPQLKDREYYENRYDRMVVMHCRMSEKSLDNSLQKSLSEMKEGEDEKSIRAMDECIRTLMLYFEK